METITVQTNYLHINIVESEYDDYVHEQFRCYALAELAKIVEQIDELSRVFVNNDNCEVSNTVENPDCWYIDVCVRWCMCV